MENKSEQVKHPSHYNQYQGFEVIDVCVQLVGPDGKSGFNLGNAFKYIARAGWKNPDNHIEDLEKARFYLHLEIERLKKAQSQSLVRADIMNATESASAKLGAVWDSARGWCCPNGDNSPLEYDQGSETHKCINCNFEQKLANVPPPAYVYRCPVCTEPLVPAPDAAITTYQCADGHGKRIFDRFYRTGSELNGTLS